MPTPRRPPRLGRPSCRPSPLPPCPWPPPVPRRASASQRRLDQRRRRGLAARGHAGGLPRRRRRADGGPRPRRPDLVAPPGAALLLSLGFRPDVAGAGADVAARGDRQPRDGRRRGGGRRAGGGAIRLKWPNDLVIEAGPGPASASSAASSARATGWGRPTRRVVGIGINADWAADAFPAELASTMTILRVAAGRADRSRMPCDARSSPGSRTGSTPSAAAASTPPPGALAR